MDRKHAGAEVAMIWLALYAIGFIGTLTFNLAIIVGPVTAPFAVLRNAVLWPVYLPILIYGSRP